MTRGTLDTLREVLAEHAGDAVTIDPMDAAAGPRLAGVRDRVRRARRRRAAGAGLAAALAVAGVLVAVSALPRSGPAPAPAGPAVLRTTSAALDEDGLPPLLDPARRPLQAATSVDAAGPREQTLRFTPQAAPDGGATLLVQCTGSPAARVAWFVGGRRGGDVRCGTGRGAAFVSPTAGQWSRLGAVPGEPAQVTLRVLGPAGDDAGTGGLPPATALLGVYEDDDPSVTGPALRSGDAVGRRDGVAGLDRAVDLPALTDVEGATTTLLAATDMTAAPGAVRAFRLDAGSLDGLVATAACRETAEALGGGSLRVAVAGRAFADLGCSDQVGSPGSSWPRGDAGTTWRGYGVPEDAPVTVVLRVRTADEVDRAAGPSAARSGASSAGSGPAVVERVPPRIDVGFYGVPPEPRDEPGAREASLAALPAPPATYEGLPLLGTRDLVAEDTTASLPVSGTLRRVVVRYECVGRYTSLVLMAGWSSAAGEGSRTGAPCDGAGPRRLDLNDGTDQAPWSGGSLDAGIGLTANDADAAAPIAGLSRSVVVRVTFYGR